MTIYGGTEDGNHDHALMDDDDPRTLRRIPRPTEIYSLPMFSASRTRRPPRSLSSGYRTVLFGRDRCRRAKFPQQARGVTVGSAVAR